MVLERDGSSTTKYYHFDARGFDRHAVIGDPLFVNPGQDDYRLQPDSPALALGFQPLDMTRIGLHGYDRSNY